MNAFLSIRRVALIASAGLLAAVLAAKLVARDATRADPHPAVPPAPLMIEITGVPDSLTVPMPNGPKENHIVTATLRGGAPQAVWVARAADSKYSVSIHPVGDQRYQINLNDSDLLLALGRTGGSGQFSIFAKAATGEVVASVPISFELSSPATAEFSSLYENARSPREWVKPTRVDALSVNLDPLIPGVVPTADIAGKTWRLKQTGEAAFSLPMTDEIRRSWEQAGAIHLSAGDALYRQSEFTYRAIPHDLVIPSEGLSIWIGANTTSMVPGSNEYLSIGCGEVKVYSAWLDLHRADDEKRDPDMTVGELRGFQLGDLQYVWGPTRIEYLGKIESRVKVTLWSGAVAEQKIIAYLPTRLSYSYDLEMVFNGKGHDCKYAATQLNDLIRQSHAVTVKELIAAISEREKQVGSACVLRDARQRDVALSTWVIDRLTEWGWRIGSMKETADLSAPYPKFSSQGF